MQHANPVNSFSDTRFVLHSLFSAVVLPISVFFVIAAWSPPLVFQTIPEWLDSWQKAIFSFVCHQQLDRIVHFDGVPMAVCSRCAGIYTGLSASLVLFSFFTAFVMKSMHYIVRIFVMISFVVTLDGVANIFELWYTPDYPRSLIGVLWGASIGAMLVAAHVIPSKSK